MKLTFDEITEIKVVSADVEKEFMYFDKLENGSWRLVYTKSLEGRFVLHERTPKIEHIDTSEMSMGEITKLMKRLRK